MRMIFIVYLKFWTLLIAKAIFSSLHRLKTICKKATSKKNVSELRSISMLIGYVFKMKKHWHHRFRFCFFSLVNFFCKLQIIVHGQRSFASSHLAKNLFYSMFAMSILLYRKKMHTKLSKKVKQIIA